MLLAATSTICCITYNVEMFPIRLSKATDNRKKGSLLNANFNVEFLSN